MDRAQLQELQAPLKERYRAEPAATLITLSASGSLGEGVSCSVIFVPRVRPPMAASYAV